MAKYTKLDIAIVALSIVFIIILLVSGYFERDVLVLHLFQSLIYVTIIILSLKHNKWGYGIAISIAAFWNTFNIFSGFFRAGINQWEIFLSTGGVTNPVNLVAPPAGLDHLALIVCSAWAYARLPNKKIGDIWVLFGSFVLSVGCLLVMVVLLWSQFLPRIRQILFG
jgi:hypothetical protein